MLEVKNINVYYGAIHAIKDISFQVNVGEVISLIGANGAGKSTTLNAISGLLRSKTGSMQFDEKNIQKMEPHKILKAGLAQVPEGRHVFGRMTVQENLDMGAFTRDDDEIKTDMEGVYERLPRLRERRKQLAGTLSGGEQQMLAMGRAIMSRPSMLMLDEPSMGLAPLLVEEIFTIITDLQKDGKTILLVEQNAKMALSIADRAYVLESGKIVLEGNASDLQNNEAVKSAYLGG